MPRGGRRVGAGRPQGAASARTRAIADTAAARGLSPLEIMLEAMRSHYAEGEFDAAVKVAALAAPYMHPRLGALEPRPTWLDEVEKMLGIRSQPSDLEPKQLSPDIRDALLRAMRAPGRKVEDA